MERKMSPFKVETIKTIVRKYTFSPEQEKTILSYIADKIDEKEAAVKLNTSVNLFRIAVIAFVKSKYAEEKLTIK